MTIVLSSNEKEVLKVFFLAKSVDVEPSLAELIDRLKKPLLDQKKNPISDPDPRYVAKIKSTGLKKIDQALKDLAGALRLHTPESEDSHSEKPRMEGYQRKSRGVLKGFHFATNTNVYLIYTLEEGPVAWYIHDDSSCEKCQPGGECQETLNLIIKERSLVVLPEVAKLSFSEKAKWVLETLNGERMN